VLQIPGLAAGFYTFDLVLIDTEHPGQQATAQVAGVDVMAGSDTATSVNITCSFCPQ
jgi:hypothetical protein